MNGLGKALVIILTFFAIVNVISFFVQDRISVNGGRDYDGMNYYDMAEKFSEGKKPIGPAPYIYRIGTPFLAGLINPGGNLIEGFFLVNLLANFIACILLFLYLKIFIQKFSVTLVLIILYLTHWLCNTRFVYYAPVNTDPWSMCFFLSGLILLELIKREDSIKFLLLLSIVSFAGVMFREYLLIIPTAFLFIKNPIDNSKPFYLDFKKMFLQNGIYFLPIVAGIFGIVLAHFVGINDANDYSFLRTAAHWLYTKTPLHYLRSVFIVFGPMIVIFIFFRKQIKDFLKENQHLSVILIAAAILSFVGGTDTERFLIWFFPVMLVITGIVIEKNLNLLKHIPILFVLIPAQIISNRVFLKTSQPLPEDSSFHFPVLTQIGEGDFFNLTSLYANKLFGIISLSEYLLIALFLYLMLRYYSVRNYNAG